MIFPAVKGVKTISLSGDMHVFTLTLWGGTIGVNLSLSLFLFIANDTVSLLFSEKGNMHSMVKWG